MLPWSDEAIRGGNRVRMRIMVKLVHQAKLYASELTMMGWLVWLLLAEGVVGRYWGVIGMVMSLWFLRGQGSPSSFLHRKNLWLVLLIWLSIRVWSIWRSVHIPTSLDAVLLSAVTIIWTWWWSGLSQPGLWLQRLGYWSSWFLALASTIWVIVQSVVPNFSVFLQARGLWAEGVSRSDLTTLLVLCLPLTLIQIIFPNQPRYRLPRWLGIWLLVVLALSRDMIGIWTSLAVLLVFLGWFFSKLSYLDKWVLFLSISFLGAFAILFQLVIQSDLRFLLCESQPFFETNCLVSIRAHHWQNAWEISKQFHFRGAGLATYPYTAKNFLNQPRLENSPHNWALSALHDTGWLGLGFTLVVLLITLWIGYQQTRHPLGKAIFLSIVLFWLLASFTTLVDRWTVWLWFWLLVGLTHSWILEQALPSFHRTQTSLKALASGGYTVVIWWMAVVVLLVWSMGGVADWWEVKPHQEQTSKKWQLPLLGQGIVSAWGPEHSMKWYWHDADWIYQTITVSQGSEKQELLKRLSELDPWVFLNKDCLRELDWEQLELVEAVSTHLWQLHQSNNSNPPRLSAKNQVDLADHFYELASIFYKHQQYAQSGSWLFRAYQVDSEVLSRSSPFLLTTSHISKNEWEVMLALVAIPQSAYGDNVNQYQEYYQTLVLQTTQDLAVQLDNAVRAASHPSSQPSPEVDLQYQTELKKIGKNLIILTGLLSRVVPNTSDQNPAVLHTLAETMLRTANYSVSHQTGHLSELYGLAIKLEPAIMYERLWWFEQPGLTKHNAQDVYDFLDDWPAWKGDWVGGRSEIFKALLNQALAHANSDTSDRATAARRQRYYQEIIKELP